MTSTLAGGTGLGAGVARAAAAPVPAGRIQSMAALAGGNLGYALLQWLLLLLVARGYGVAAAGDLTLGLSVTAPVFVLCGLQLRMLMITDTELRRRLRLYVRLRSWSGLAAVVLSVAVAVLLVGAPRAVLVCALVALCKYVELWGDLASAMYQARGRLSRLLVAQGARGALAVAAVGLAVASDLGLVGALALWLVAWCAFELGFDRPAVAAGALEAGATAAEDAAQFWRTTLWAGAALGVAAFLNSLAANLPRLWLGRQATREALGELGAVSYIIAAASVVLGAAVLGLAPSFARPRGEPRRTGPIVAAAAAACALAAACAALVWWQAGPLVTALLGPAFRGSAHLLRIAVWALPFYAVAAVGNAAAAAERRGRQQVVAYAVTLLATAAALAMPRGGGPAEVAASALVLASAVQAVAVMAGLWLGGEPQP